MERRPAQPLLEVRNLTLALPGTEGEGAGIQDLTFSLASGEILALVGPSGSGKSALALALLGLLRPPGRVVGGEIRFAGRNLLRLQERELRRLRGGEIALVLQDPLPALDPLQRAGAPVAEAVRLHEGLSGRAARARALECLRRAGLRDPARVFRRYPHELSGGMRQRVLLAAALAGRPRLLVADEPTASLDAPLRRHVLTLLRRLSERTRMAVLLITHDLAEAALADRVLVLRDGRAVETGPSHPILSRPGHPFTAELRRAALEMAREAAPPRRRAESGQAVPLLELREVHKHFAEGSRLVSRRMVRALDGVSLAVAPGETLGIAGESGCGKTTLLRTALRLLAPTGGRILFRGEDVTRRPERELGAFRRDVQAVFQDPAASLDPRMAIGEAVAEALAIRGWAAPDRRARAAEVLDQAGLGRAAADRYPHELSTGQRQLACLARALAPRPALIALDEPVSSLDALFRYRVVRLLEELREALDLGYLIVSHDAAVLRRLADRVLVLFRGRVVEAAPAGAWSRHPLHPYSHYLLGSALPDPGLPLAPSPAAAWEGQPDLGEAWENPAGGCPYALRCSRAQPRCRTESPSLAAVAADHRVACHLPG